MHDLGVQVYLLQIHQQCEFALYSYEKMDEISSDCIVSGAKFWCYAQSMLSCTANISKYLWGRKYGEDRELIRKLLDIQDDSPLKDRQVRNHIEHFDERLLQWEKRIQDDEIYTDAGIGTEDSYNDYTYTPFRYYAMDTNIIYFKDLKFDINNMVVEIRRVRNRCMRVLFEIYDIEIHNDYMNDF